MQVSNQCRVDASPDWVRSFLLAGTREDDVTVDGDVIEVRQRDRLIDLVVRNRLRPDGEGGTLVDVDANLRLLGLARVVGGLFHRRVRRTLERGLDRLPTAMEQALAVEQPLDGENRGARAYGRGIVEDEIQPTEVQSMSDDHEHRERHDAEATTASEASQDSQLEADKRVPEGAREAVEKAATEAGGGDGVVDAVKRVGREVDRTFGGEYEAREDEAAAKRTEEGAGG
ncbi:MAG: hypothetical protein M3Z57_00405 [Candidatus Dormibacteraeota bacterium]|nr:hypothetical protein [Candidatus Dormibacteraeota bacterium]